MIRILAAVAVILVPGPVPAAGSCPQGCKGLFDPSVPVVPGPGTTPAEIAAALAAVAG